MSILKQWSVNMISTTGTTIKTYLQWVEAELEKKNYGEVTIKFVVRDHRVVDVRKESVETEHYSKTI